MNYPHITPPTDNQPARLARLPRVRVAQIVMDYLAHGWSVEEMCRQHPDLTLAETHAAMLYYWDHQDEVDREIEDEWKHAERDAAASTLPPALRARLSKSA